MRGGAVAGLKKRLSKSISSSETAFLVSKDDDTDSATTYRPKGKMTGISKMLGSDKNVRTWNIAVNAVAAMFVYSSYYGGAAVMPTAFTDMMGRNGIDNHTAFTGLMVNNLFVALAAFITPFMIKIIGFRLSLVLGSLCSIPIALALFMPYGFTIILGQAINGIGNALTRAVSLQFLSVNSTEQNMARNSGIHWMIFMSCILIGNTVLFFGIGNRRFLDDGTRMVVAGALTAMCGTGSLLFCFTQTPPPLDQDVDENTSLIKTKTLSEESISTSSSSLSVGSNSETKELLENTGVLIQLKDSLKPLFKWKNVYMLLPLCSTGIYSQLYTPLIPSYIGILFKERSYIAQFGMFVGIGEIVGGQLAGKLVTYLGFKKSSILVTLLGISMFTLLAFMFPLFYTSAPILYPSHWGNNLLGVAIGVIDVSNNVILTTAIGTVYKNDSAQIFTLVVLMMNSSGIIRYIMMSYLPLIVIVSVNIVGLVGSCGSIYLIPERGS